ncbi:MAG: phosphoglycerate mutase family protein [Nanoarchaeota archaeon]
MKKVKIYLFRHGETFYNEKGIFTGWKNAKLSPKGMKSARKIAMKLKDKKFEIAFYTRLSRSKDTLKEVLKFHPECKKLIKDDRMIERNYGILNGTSHENFIRKFGKEKYDKIHRGFDTKAKGGESFAMVEKRVKSFIKDLRKILKREKKNVAISAHGNSIRLFRKIMEKATREQAIKWIIPYDKYYEYSIKVKNLKIVKKDKKFIEKFVNLYINIIDLEISEKPNKVKIKERYNQIKSLLPHYPILFEDLNLLYKIFNKLIETKRRKNILEPSFYAFLDWTFGMLYKNKEISKLELEKLKDWLSRFNLEHMKVPILTSNV